MALPVARIRTSVTAAVIAIGLTVTAHAATRCVKPSGVIRPNIAARLGCTGNVYSTISDAVAASSADDVIYVLSGTYSEMVSIPSKLSGLMLIGQNPKNTIVDATGQANGFFDQASDVTIEDFTVENAEHEGILVEGPGATCSGGECTPSAPQITGVTIADNIVENNDKALTSGPACPATGNVPAAPAFEQEDCGEGVHVDGAAFSTVSDNLISNNAGGVLLTDETNPNNNNVVDGNTVKDNTPDCGITLPSHPPNGSSTNIETESFGVFNDTIANNLSEDNGAAGTGVFAPTPGTASYGHVIVGNRLIGNTNPGVVFHSHAPHQKISHVSVIGNFISGNGAEPNVDATGDGPANPTGVEVFADLQAEPLNGINIAGNTIKKESTGIWVGAPSWANCGSDPTPCYNVDAHLNNFQPHSVGISNQGSSSVMVNGVENYWGCGKGPGGNPACATATGNVSDEPFLVKPASIGGNP